MHRFLSLRNDVQSLKQRENKEKVILKPNIFASSNLYLHFLPK